MSTKWKFSILGIIFILSIFLFATEVPFFQYILKSTSFVLFFTSLALVITYLTLRKMLARHSFKDGFVLFGFLSIFNVFLVVSIASKFNRLNISQQGQRVKITDIKYEFNSMFGILEADKQRAQATHIRMTFDHKGKEYNRAFKIKNVFVGQEEEDLYVIIDKGKLGFDYIRY